MINYYKLAFLIKLCFQVSHTNKLGTILSTPQLLKTNGHLEKLLDSLHHIKSILKLNIVLKFSHTKKNLHYQIEKHQLVMEQEAVISMVKEKAWIQAFTT